MTFKSIKSGQSRDSNTSAFDSTPVKPPKLSERAAQQVQRIQRWEDDSARKSVHLED
ncbi:hypothetical protein J6524_09750 [Bradyrhizobium sp. WSM 1738]|uniref:hypothetical protein n=1 Tax=Bradyrhizobium hereditatis TaxID=2821405 RepID=UPI001CE2A708|nr:hypothetical protein [Bradyrhizobium hereditatis]MCA6115183.1 hypothetical protein [Bradyrhizobium hereditatis]